MKKRLFSVLMMVMASMTLFAQHQEDGTENHTFYYFWVETIPTKNKSHYIEVFSETDIIGELLNANTTKELCDIISKKAYYSGDVYFGYQHMLRKLYQLEELKTKDFNEGMWLQNYLSEHSRKYKKVLDNNTKCIIECCHLTGTFWKCNYDDVGTTSLTIECEGLASKPCYVLKEVISVEAEAK